MYLFKKRSDLISFVVKMKQAGHQIGFIPTMGALHKGHMSLIERSKEENNLTICSIFINPTQFNDPKDFEKYPQTLSSDIDFLSKANCDVLFLPSVQEVYTDGINEKRADLPLSGLDLILEGSSRPGHFQGVAHVVKLLLDIVKPQSIYLGQKDFQQVLVIREMIHHFKLPVKIVCSPIIREPSGLAMSSRNIRLSESTRIKAGVIHNALVHIEANYRHRSLHELLEEARQMILQELPDATIDYLLVADSKTLETEEERKTNPRVILIAVWVEGVRLLDNILLP